MNNEPYPLFSFIKHVILERIHQVIMLVKGGMSGLEALMKIELTSNLKLQ
jgi:hypothetical protein